MIAFPKRAVVEVAQSFGGRRFLSRFRDSSSPRLQEVGKLQKPLDPQDATLGYKKGQLFLHAKFGYRGVILFPWKTKILETQKPPTLPVKDGDETLDILCGDMDKPNHVGRPDEMFYNVLVDSRDYAYARAHVDAATTFLCLESSTPTLLTLPGVDLVHNQDVLPYRLAEPEYAETPSESIEGVFLHHYAQGSPIVHESFHKFFQVRFPRKSVADPPYRGTTALLRWQRRNSRWLKPEAAFRAENFECGTRITVIPFCMGSLGGGGGESATSGSDDGAGTERFFLWRYILRVENVGTKTLHIKSRSCTHTTKMGTHDKSTCVGLDGREIVLSPWTPCAQIIKFCGLNASSGSIWGHLDIMDGEGKSYECPIPHFTLKSQLAEIPDGTQDE